MLVSDQHAYKIYSQHILHFTPDSVGVTDLVKRRTVELRPFSDPVAWRAELHKQLARLNQRDRASLDHLRFTGGTATRDGRWVVGFFRNMAVVLTPSLRSVVAVFTVGEEEIGQAIFTPDSRWLLLSGGGGRIDVIDTRQWTRRRTLRHGQYSHTLSPAPSGNTFLSGSGSWSTWRWDLGRAVKAAWKISDGSMHAFVLSDDVYLERCLDAPARLRAMDDGRILQDVAPCAGTAPLVVGSTVAYPSADMSQIHVFDLERRAPVQRLPLPKKVGRLWWRPATESVVYRRSPSGARHELWTRPLGPGRPSRLTEIRGALEVLAVDAVNDRLCLLHDGKPRWLDLP